MTKPLTWDEIAELVKMPGGLVSVTLFDGTSRDISHDTLRAIVNAAYPHLAIEERVAARRPLAPTTPRKR